ncbi:restriction endonuclease subunit S [Nostocoides australiense]|uniref:restriction endonuclease subunit S n=1 Tax=Nostocoides australiense TaxID=99480 RepID=UPI00069F8644|nr:restriction endonuclease subunit S [Tetrasphaera australiensis]
MRPGQTLFGKRRAYQRKAAYAEVDAICSGDILVFEAMPGQISPRLLPFLVHSDAFFDHALGTSAGSLSPRTNWRALADFEVALPDIDEQERIADLLWAIENHRARLQTLRAAGDVTREASVRLGLKRAAEEQVTPVTELLAKSAVGVVVRPASHYTDAADGVVALRSLNVQPGGFTLDDVVRFKPDSHAALSKSTLQVGDVVVVRTGRPGDAAVVNEEVAGLNCIDLIILRTKNSLDPHYLAAFLNSDGGRSQVRRGSAGTAQQHFNVGALRKLEIPLPEVEQQQRLVGVWQRLTENVNTVQAEMDSLSALRSSLVDAVFGGAP